MSTVIPFALAIMLGSLGADLVRYYTRRLRAWVLFDLRGHVTYLDWLVR